ncbi:hypothetical protein [Stieleria varia]|nr:hypothetical protein [Stieleria varia]
MRVRLGQFWPDGLQERFVTRGYVSSDWSIDSSSTFIRFDADLPAVAQWRAFLRTDNYASAVSLDNKDDRWCEVREQRCASIPLSSLTGEVPAWWNPTGDICDTFETMVWYDQIDSGVGRGNYLQYDPNTSTAWVYSYSCQHDLLWDRGDGAPVAIADTPKPSQ